MNKYIVTEKELELVYLDFFGKEMRKEILKDFLADKKPVTEIASGEIYSLTNKIEDDIEFKSLAYQEIQVNNKNGNYVTLFMPSEQLELGKTITIYMESE